MYLQTWQMLNVGAMTFNTGSTYLIGRASAEGSYLHRKFGFITNREASKRAQSLSTPSSWAFAIWGIIFPAEILSIGWQCTLTDPALVSVFAKASPYWVTACVAQGAWAVAFAAQKKWTALGLIIVTTVATGMTYHTVATPSLSGATFLIGTVPFGMHTAWLIAATLVSCNMRCVEENVSAKTQITVAYVTRVTAAAVGMWLSTYYMDPTFSLVSAWALKAVSTFPAGKGKDAPIVKAVEPATLLSLTSVAKNLSTALCVFAAGITVATLLQE